MRIHSLEITAFGPFADTVSVDFDALSGAGLFLLTGPTGAGKSSILDAVAFGLYGDVPGDRAGAKRLRCDTAPDEVAPRVVLEVTLSGRLFRIERSPAWVRPKRRGSGTTTEQARVVIAERHDGAWQTLSTRLDETGHLVTRLVGMNLSQFCQVALLPQGRFQAFLRARSEERQALLQQLFRSGRFDQVERWLRDRRTHLRKESQAHEAVTADLVSRVSEVADTAPPAEWTHEPPSLLPWVGSLVGDELARVEDSTAELARAEQQAATDEASHTEALRVHEIDTKARAAEARLSALDLQAPAMDALRTTLATASRAAGLKPVLALLRDARDADMEADAARQGADDQLRDLLDGEVTSTDLGQLHHDVRTSLERCSSMGDELELLPVWSSRIVEIDADLDAHQTTMAELGRRAEALPDDLSRARDAVRRVDEAAVRSDVLRDQVTSLQARQQARDKAARLEADRNSANAEVERARAEVNTARETWLALRERRIDGMAAEIASSLAVGCGCPVCGSAEHPAPAVATAGAPTAEEEKQARSLVDDAEIVLEARRHRLRDLDTLLAVARSEAGDTEDDLEGQLHELFADFSVAEEQAATRSLAEQQLARLEAESLQLGDLREATLTKASTLETERAEMTRLVDSVRTELEEMTSRWNADSPADLTRRLARLEGVVSLAMESRAHSEHCARHLREARMAADQAVREAGFDSIDTAERGSMPDTQIAELEQRIRSHDDEVARLSSVLQDAEVLAVRALPVKPDPQEQATRLDSARRQLVESRRRHDQATSRLARLASLEAELRQCLDAWSPVAQDLELVSSLASFAEGKSPDNRLQMRLSAYVLAHRLSQVVDAANLRLWRMSSQRYALVHTGQRGAKETRGGLSLLVRDEWSGEARDPATLSGGETFVVSLALALGLADVIMDEAGGTDLHTLFVDEGFGALDADTLDDVMDTLDELRDGGRVVGVVSHVAELQTRIPTQLRVSKGRNGSGVSMRVS